MNYVYLLSGTLGTFWNETKYVNQWYDIKKFCNYVRETADLWTETEYVRFWPGSAAHSVSNSSGDACSFLSLSFATWKVGLLAMTMNISSVLSLCWALYMIYLFQFFQHSHKAGAVIPIFLEKCKV